MRVLKKEPVSRKVDQRIEATSCRGRMGTREDEVCRVETKHDVCFLEKKELLKLIADLCDVAVQLDDKNTPALLTLASMSADLVVKS